MGLYDLYNEDEDPTFNPGLYSPAPGPATSQPTGALAPLTQFSGSHTTDPTAAFRDPETGRGRDREEVDPSAGGPNFNIPGAPRFDPGAPFVPPEFRRPTLAEAEAEPGYQLRLSAGNRALERSAAARGVLRTGGTLSDLVEYNQNFASGEYGQVFNRALAGYDRSYQAASGAYDRAYQGRRDMFAPRLAEWQLRSNAEIQRGMAAYGYNTRERGGGGGGPNIPAPPDPPPFRRPPNTPEKFLPDGSGDDLGDVKKFDDNPYQYYQ